MENIDIKNDGQENLTEIQERAIQVLENCVDTCVMYIDTCSLLYFSAIDFFDNVENLLMKYSKKIYILSGGIKEIEKHSANTKEQNLASNAKKRLE